MNRKERIVKLTFNVIVFFKTKTKPNNRIGLGPMPMESKYWANLVLILKIFENFFKLSQIEIKRRTKNLMNLKKKIQKPWTCLIWV